MINSFLVILKSSDTLKRRWLEALRNGGNANSRYEIRSPREKRIEKGGIN
jgi:hypothetical protein